jgi:hypothetical protein
LALISLIAGISEELPLMTLLSTVGIFVFAAIFALGIAEVIHLIAKIEFNTRMRENNKMQERNDQMNRLLAKIANNTEKGV